jgi:hypothetical protein
MSAPGYEIKDPVSLSAHAGKVAGVAEGIRAASAAGSQVGLGDVHVYGLLCSPLLIPALQAFQGDVDELLQSASDLAGALSEGIKGTIANYDDLERQLKTHYDTFGGAS